MSLYRRKNIWQYDFCYQKKRYKGSTSTRKLTIAREIEKKKREEAIEDRYEIGEHRRDLLVRPFSKCADDYLDEFTLRHPKATWIGYCVSALKNYFGNKAVSQIDEASVIGFQNNRLKAEYKPKTINHDIGVLFRIVGNVGDPVRAELKRRKKLFLKPGKPIGVAISSEDEDRLIDEAAASTRSPHIFFVIQLALATAMRDAEMRNLTWGQIDLLKKVITVGDSKTDAGTGRTIPIGPELRKLFVQRGRWFQEKFKVKHIPKDWHVFPGGRVGHFDPTKAVTTFKTAWKRVRKNAGVAARFHDMRHTAVTNLIESDSTNDETVMQIAGHVSRQMLSHYSHLRMQAKRKAMQALDRKRGTHAA